MSAFRCFVKFSNSSSVSFTELYFYYNLTLQQNKQFLFKHLFLTRNPFLTRINYISCINYLAKLFLCHLLKYLFKTTLFCVLSLTCQASSTIQIQEFDCSPLDLIPHCGIFQTEKELNPNEAAELIARGKLSMASNEASQGFSNNYYWLEFSLEGTEHGKELILEVDNPHIDDIALYQKKGDWVKIGFGGDRNRRFKDRSYLNRRYLFPTRVNSETSQFLLMIDKRNASVSFPFRLWEKKIYLEHEAKLNIIYGIFFGVFFFVSLVSILFGLFIRRSLSVLYGAYALSMVLYQFTALGFSYQFLYPYSESFNNYSRLLLIVLISVFSISFTRKFLDLDKNAPRTNRSLKIMSYVLMGLFASWMLFFDLFTIYTIWIINVIYILVMSTFILCLIGVSSAYTDKKKQAKTYLAAFGALIIACCLYIGVEYGVINESIFVINPILIGSGIEILILAIFMLKWAKQLVQDNTRSNTLEALVQLEATTTDLRVKIPLGDHQKTNSEILESGEIETTWLVFKDHQKIDQNTITHIKSDGHYLLIYTEPRTKPIMERMTFKKATMQLSPAFIRTHRSFMVNKNWIAKYNSTQITLKDGIQLPLSRTYKEAFFEAMEKN